MGKKQRGGVNVSGSKLKARDIIGRDKIDVNTLDQDEKSGWLLFMERSFIFIWTMGLGGVMLSGFGYFVAFSTLGDRSIGIIAGLVLAFLFAITMTGNVSRYRA